MEGSYLSEDLGVLGIYNRKYRFLTDNGIYRLLTDTGECTRTLFLEQNLIGPSGIYVSVYKNTLSPSPSRFRVWVFSPPLLDMYSHL